ncbi:MAG TPA: hypothetical protein VJ010_01595 [Actinomycetota bacterium]|nr:hypothetical protein [Actinomycetota bacterium]
MRPGRRGWWRWLIGAGSGAVIVAGTVGYGPGGSAGAAPAPGVGSSYAQSFQVTPHEGSLAVGLVLGEALAGHTNNIARAQSQGEDLGAIGLSMQGYNCGTAPSDTQVALVPQPLQAETTPTGGTVEKTQTPTTGADHMSSSSFPPSFGSTEHVITNGTPYGEANTSYGEFGGNGFTVSGTTSKAWSGLLNGQRVAAATSDIGEIDLGGQVVLKNLHWEVTYPSGGGGQPSGSFSIGQLTIGGQSVPTGDPSAAIDAVNTALKALGIQLAPPKAAVVQGVNFVSPLELDWVPNPARDKVAQTVVNPAMQAFHPVANGLETGFGPPEPKELAAALCQSDTPITVADITIASFTGAGYFNMALGGVNATSGDAPANPYNLNPFEASSTPGSSQLTAGTAGTPASAPTGGTEVLGTNIVNGGNGPTTLAAGGSRPIRRAAASRAVSGPLLGIGLGGLGLLALLAEGDRRMMRRAHRRPAFEFEE